MKVISEASVTKYAQQDANDRQWKR